MRRYVVTSKLPHLFGWVLTLPLVRPMVRIGQNLSEKNATLVAGGVAFYGFLAIFPAIFSIIFLWELFATDANAFVLLDFLSYLLPEQAFEVIGDLLIQITEREKPASIWAAAISLLIALWSSSRAIDALLLAIHMMYRNPYRRGLILQRLIAIGFTLAGIAFVIFSFVLISAVPPVLNALNLDGFAEVTMLSVRWLIILILFALGAYAFYFTSRRRLESGNRKHRNKLLPGTFWASFIWLIVSLAFSYALSSFISYKEAFGSLGAIAALLMWLWLTALALLIGAEINTDFDGKLTRALALQKDAQSPIPPSD